VAMAIPELDATGPPAEVRVLIVDDQHLFADAIRWALERVGMIVTGVAISGEQALAMARRERPDLVLLDLGLPGISGTEVGKVLLEEVPGVKVLAVTAMTDARAIREAMGAGFHGYLTKDTQVTDFVDLIRLALGGHVVMPEGLARAAVGGRTYGEQRAALLASELTSREGDVLALLAEGASTSEVAARLSITKNTVRTHVQSILAKLQVHHRLEAVAFAVRYGIIEPPGK
jgi:DNA-binding NarL/FixJ family response regulator